MNKAVIFDKNTIDFVLDLLNMTTDEEGFILEKDSMKQITTKDGNKIHKNELCFISKNELSTCDLHSLMNIVKLYLK